MSVIACCARSRAPRQVPERDVPPAQALEEDRAQGDFSFSHSERAVLRSCFTSASTTLLVSARPLDHALVAHELLDQDRDRDHGADRERDDGEAPDPEQVQDRRGVERRMECTGGGQIGGCLSRCWIHGLPFSVWRWLEARKLSDRKLARRQGGRFDAPRTLA
jgi:hypothetical protein